MASPAFSDVYVSSCDHCGADLEDWDWLEDDMVFYTTCTCGTEYKLEPTAGILTAESDTTIEDDEDEG